VRFWGLILAARQFNHKGKDLWGDHTSTDGVREAPCFQKYMAHWRFEQIRKLVKWAKANTSSVVPEWRMFEKMVADFNTNRSEVMHFSAWGTADESMSAYQPRVTKCGGLPNISFIKRKPKPLGTEFKTLVDAVT
jgi:hypothetical protein